MCILFYQGDGKGTKNCQCQPSNKSIKYQLRIYMANTMTDIKSVLDIIFFFFSKKSWEKEKLSK